MTLKTEILSLNQNFDNFFYLKAEKLCPDNFKKPKFW